MTTKEQQELEIKQIEVVLDNLRKGLTDAIEHGISLKDAIDMLNLPKSFLTEE